MLKRGLLLLFLIIPAFSALVKPGYFPMHDDIQGMRVLQMHECILDWQVPCRWVPDMGFGYGYPQFNFYSPLPYYLMEIFVLLGVSILSTVKIGFVLSIILSAFSMYLLGSHLWGKKGGILSVLFYTYAPYRAVDVYVRGAMGEAWGFVFMPLIVLFTLKGKTLPLALAFGGLLLTHNITTIMFLPFYVFFVLLLGKQNLGKYKSVFVGGIWGLALSAFFTFPAFFEKDYTHVESVLQGYFNYLAHFVGLGQLLLSTYWGYGVSSLGALDGMNLSVGILHWSVAVFAVTFFVILKKWRMVRLVAVFVLLGFVALFLAHPKSQFVWDGVSILSYIQFPWRFLAIAVFCFSLASGSIVELIQSRKRIFLTILFLVLLLINGSYFKPQRYIQISDDEKFSGESWRQQQTISILDYLPRAASHAPLAAAPSSPEILDTEGWVVDGDKGTNWQNWEVYLENAGRVRIQQFDFPGWEAEVDGEKVQIDSENELGLITVDVLEGTHFVKVRLRDTNIRMVSNFLSLIALMAVPFYYKKFR